MLLEKFWIFVWTNFRNFLKWMELSVVLNTVYVVFVYFTMYSTNSMKYMLSKIVVFYDYGVAKCR